MNNECTKIVYNYQLRKDCIITMHLPMNLTMKEVNKIIDFLNLISFEETGEFDCWMPIVSREGEMN